jgi:hypothetical protein
MFAEKHTSLFTTEHQLPGQMKTRSEKNINDFEKILVEYSLKRNNFNPKDNSPNIFINKLKKRFNCYYSS